MAIQRTQWHPDTCECILEYEWDDTESIEQRTHSLKNVVKACEFHKSHPAPELYKRVHHENTSKNKAFGHIANELSTHVTSDEHGNKSFKDGHVPSYEFDKDRKLHITIPNATPAQKSALKLKLPDIHIK